MEGMEQQYGETFGAKEGSDDIAIQVKGEIG